MGYVEKETNSRVKRPDPPKPRTGSNVLIECKHNYRVVNSDVEESYFSGKRSMITNYDILFYCTKCLDLKRKTKSFRK